MWLVFWNKLVPTTGQRDTPLEDQCGSCHANFLKFGVLEPSHVPEVKHCRWLGHRWRQGSYGSPDHKKEYWLLFYIFFFSESGRGELTSQEERGLTSFFTLPISTDRLQEVAQHTQWRIDPSPPSPDLWALQVPFLLGQVWFRARAEGGPSPRRPA